MDNFEANPYCSSSRQVFVPQIQDNFFFPLTCIGTAGQVYYAWTIKPNFFQRTVGQGSSIYRTSVQLDSFVGTNRQQQAFASGRSDRYQSAELSITFVRVDSDEQFFARLQKPAYVAGHFSSPRLDSNSGDQFSKNLLAVRQVLRYKATLQKDRSEQSRQKKFDFHRH